jgi:hypothetical protein
LASKESAAQTSLGFAPYDTARRVGVRNNPTQAKRRLEWAPKLFLKGRELGEGDAPLESGCWIEGVFHLLG